MTVAEDNVVQDNTVQTEWPFENVAETWRAARSTRPDGYLNAATCNVPSDRVLESVIDHLQRERAVGGYVAAPEAAPLLDAGRAALADCVGAAAADVAFVENGTAAFASVVAGWGLPRGARVAVVRSEFGSNRLLLDRLAVQNDWTLVELPTDGHGRILLDALAEALARGLDLVTFPHVASHRGTLQPAQDAGRLCRDAGVPLILDVCQSLAHVDVSGIEAAAYVGTSRKWLAGPRGAGFVIVPDLTVGTGPDTPAPTFHTHGWDVTGGRPVAGARRYEHDEASYAVRVGLATAALEYRALGPAAVHARLAGIGRAARTLLDGVGGWRAAEPLDEPTAIITLLPPNAGYSTASDPTAGSTALDASTAAVEQAVRAARAAGLQVGPITPARAPSDLPLSVLRVSLSVGSQQRDVATLAEVLAS